MCITIFCLWDLKYFLCSWCLCERCLSWFPLKSRIVVSFSVSSKNKKSLIQDNKTHSLKTYTFWDSGWSYVKFQSNHVFRKSPLHSFGSLQQPGLPVRTEHRRQEYHHSLWQSRMFPSQEKSQYTTVFINPNSFWTIKICICITCNLYNLHSIMKKKEKKLVWHKDQWKYQGSKTTMQKHLQTAVKSSMKCA